MVRGGPRRHGHLSLWSGVPDRGLRRDIVDMNGTGVPMKEKNAYATSTSYVERKNSTKIVAVPSVKGRDGRVRKPDGQLVPLGYGYYYPSTYGLSTWSSPTAL